MTVPRAKLQALRERLAAGDTVQFKTGAQVRIERRVVVKGPWDGITVYTEKELEKAYELANRPPGPFPAPLRPELDQRYGVSPPW